MDRRQTAPATAPLKHLGLRTEPRPRPGSSLETGTRAGAESMKRRLFNNEVNEPLPPGMQTQSVGATARFAPPPQVWIRPSHSSTQIVTSKQGPGKAEPLPPGMSSHSVSSNVSLGAPPSAAGSMPQLQPGAPQSTSVFLPYMAVNPLRHTIRMPQQGTIHHQPLPQPPQSLPPTPPPPGTVIVPALVSSHQPYCSNWVCPTSPPTLHNLKQQSLTKQSQTLPFAAGQPGSVTTSGHLSGQLARPPTGLYGSARTNGRITSVPSVRPAPPTTAKAPGTTVSIRPPAILNSKVLVYFERISHLSETCSAFLTSATKPGKKMAPDKVDNRGEDCGAEVARTDRGAKKPIPRKAFKTIKKKLQKRQKRKQMAFSNV